MNFSTWKGLIPGSAQEIKLPTFKLEKTALLATYVVALPSELKKILMELFTITSPDDKAEWILRNVKQVT